MTTPMTSGACLADLYRAGDKRGIRVYPVFHTRYCLADFLGLYYTAPSDAINPEALHPVLLNARGYIPCMEEVTSAVIEEALKQGAA